MSLNTAFLLMAQYNGKAIIPLDAVRAILGLFRSHFFCQFAYPRPQPPVGRVVTVANVPSHLHWKSAEVDGRR